MLQLLRKIKAKGFYEATCGKPASPDKNESAWVREQIELIQNHGIPLHPSGTLSDMDGKWFCDYLKRPSHVVKTVCDIKSVEKKLKLRLPKSYVDFITRFGSVSFENVDEQRATMVHVVAPEELDAKNYRKGSLNCDDEETNAIDGIMFARATDGDCFCFNVEKGRKEYAVFVYKHEYNCFEPYADNFAVCLKRFVG